GNHVADRLLAIGGDRTDLAYFIGTLDLLRTLLEVFDGGRNREIDAAPEIHGVHASGYRLAALAHDRLGEHAGRGGSIAGDVIGLRGDFAHHLGAHVLELVLKLDFLRDRDTVLGGARGAERLVDHDVAALGTQGNLYRIGENIDASQHSLAGFAGEAD